MLKKLQILFKSKKKPTVRTIKITKASVPTYWYANQIGDVFPVNPYLEKEGWYTVEFPYSNRCVRYEDCEIIG